ncbi:MAG: hypothetical protein IT292_12075 [Deltaproteobacteria bacterium]|nr:hypothetical protein [Deltaproteobacteria bacterium]
MKKIEKESMDLGDFFDPEFFPEFIKKHNVLLQDFEGAILDCKFEKTSAQDTETTHAFEKFVRSYLHSIKGDTGSIGLVGIEKVTHYFEDIVADRNACAVLDELIAYKEWVYLCFQCYTEGVPLSEDATTFTARVKERLKSPKSNPTEPSIPQPTLALPIANTEGATSSSDAANIYKIGSEIELLARVYH